MRKLRAWVLATGPRDVGTSALEVAGLACAVKGAADIYAPAGWLVAGASLVAAGIFGARS